MCLSVCLSVCPLCVSLWALIRGEIRGECFNPGDPLGIAFGPAAHPAPIWSWEPSRPSAPPRTQRAHPNSRGPEDPVQSFCVTGKVVGSNKLPHNTRQLVFQASSHGEDSDVTIDSLIIASVPSGIACRDCATVSQLQLGAGLHNLNISTDFQACQGFFRRDCILFIRIFRHECVSVLANLAPIKRQKTGVSMG